MLGLTIRYVASGSSPSRPSMSICISRCFSFPFFCLLLLLRRFFLAPLLYDAVLGRCGIFVILRFFFQCIQFFFARPPAAIPSGRFTGIFFYGPRPCQRLARHPCGSPALPALRHFFTLVSCFLKTTVRPVPP